MNKLTLTILIALLPLTVTFSQDIITTNMGEDILAKILEISPTEIKYKKYDNLSGPDFIMSSSDVLMIRYENGTKEILSVERPVTSKTSNAGKDLFFQGHVDAIRYYDGYSPAATGTLVTGLLSPLIGLLPAIACSSTKPNDVNLNYPDPNLMKEAEYYRGYTQEAKRIKRGKVWKNWGIAFGVNLVVLLAVIN